MAQRTSDDRDGRGQDVNAAQTPEEIRQSICNRPIGTAVGELKVSMSLGLLISGYWGVRPLEEMLRETDAALYAAKAAGRNCVKLAKPAQQDAKVEAIREPAVRAR